MTITKGFDGIVYSEKSIEQAPTEVCNDYRNSTYNLVSTVGYLIGVPVQYFSSERGKLSMEMFNQLDKDMHARIIRKLCIEWFNLLMLV